MQGIFRNEQGIRLTSAEIGLLGQAVTTKIPYATEQGIFPHRSGKFAL
jgi:hypothetical protein